VGRPHSHVVHSGPFSPATHVAPFVVHTEDDARPRSRRPPCLWCLP
jgi:hypothetical protein